MITTFIKNIFIGILTLNLTIAGMLGYHPTPAPQLGATIPTVVALFSTTLASAITSTATSFTLTTGTTKDGTSLSGTYGFIIDEGTSSEEFVSASCTATACTSALRGVSAITGNTEITALKKTHRRGSSVKITDHPQLAILSRVLNGSETVPNALSYASHPTFSSDTQIIDKKYADNTITGLVGTATTTNAGTVERTTVSELNAGTATGGVGPLYVNPADLAASNYFNFLPTTTQKDALVGSGTPSSSNKYVTADTDALKELLSNKSTTTTLGSSDTLYPTQNAVKTYVDGAPRFTFKNGVDTRAGNTASGTETIAHGLGRTPSRIRITVTKANGTASITQSFGAYNGTTNSSVYSVTKPGTSSLMGNSTTEIAIVQDDGSNTLHQNAIATFDGTNIYLAWTRTGSTSADVMQVLWEAE